MELSQSRPRGAQGSKPTHDFLSLYSPSEQDPTPTIPGGYMKTHDFLQPLEGNKVVKAEGIVISGAQSSNSNNNDENSNCSSYTGSGFTIWEEWNGKNGKRGKNGIGIGIGMPWMTSGKVDSGNSGQKANSPRSKHSATEQRRRSKINDRFSMLRGIIPNADQKRDKASFLLEVIEYIQFLQEKVNKYEDSYGGWTNEPSQMASLNKAVADEPKLPNCISTNDKLREKEFIVESRDFNISTMYSQGISSALTQALRRAGVDLSEANISVQIDLGKRSSANLKDNETPSIEETGDGSKRRRK